MTSRVKNMVKLKHYFYICTTFHFVLYKTDISWLKSLGDTWEVCYTKQPG